MPYFPQNRLIPLFPSTLQRSSPSSAWSALEREVSLSLSASMARGKSWGWNPPTTSCSQGATWMECRFGFTLDVLH